MDKKRGVILTFLTEIGKEKIYLAQSGNIKGFAVEEDRINTPLGELLWIKVEL